MENEFTTSQLTAASLEKYISISGSIIKEFQQPNGAYPASPYFHSYQYCWLRDSSFIAEGMSRAGESESVELYFGWCEDIILQNKSFILNGDKLEARYTYDGNLANEDWQTYQLDGYGLLLWTLKNHCDRTSSDISRWSEMIDLIQIYLTKHYTEPCIDWWEERNEIHAASLACIYAGLKAFNNPVANNVKNMIHVDNERTDGSLIVCSLFDAIESQDSEQLLARIKHELVNDQGGVYRYKEDSYYGGGAWPILAAFLGLYELKVNNQAGAIKEFQWIKGLVQDNGWIPEQADERLLNPEAYDKWVNKWGTPANPLLWSHGMFIWLCSELKELI